MDLIFNLNGSVTYLSVSIVAPFSCNPSLVSAASTKPGLMAKRAEKNNFDGHPHINLVPFILETTGRLGPHARNFISYLMQDADNPPLPSRTRYRHDGCELLFGDGTLEHTRDNATPSLFSAHCATTCKYRPNGNAHSVFSLKPTADVLCGPAVISPRLMTTSTTLTTISSSSSRTLTLRLPCSRAYLKLMYWIQPLDAGSPWTFSRLHSNIPSHLITGLHLSTLSSNSCSEVWCHARPTVAMTAKIPGQSSWKGTHITNCTLSCQTSRLHGVQLQSCCPTTPALSDLYDYSLPSHHNCATDSVFAGTRVTLSEYTLLLSAGSCDLAHQGLYCPYVFVCTHHNTLRLPFSVFAFVTFHFSDGRTAECATRAYGSQHYTLFNCDRNSFRQDMNVTPV